MKKTKIILAGLLVLAMLMSGCGKKEEDDQGGSLENTGFNYSEGIDENGFWDGVNASELVSLDVYKGIEIPASEAVPTADDIEDGMDDILEDFVENVEVTDRKAELYDTVSIAFIGRMDGKEFENGSGTKDDLVLGSGSFIDGFEDGIVGHMPGETFYLDLTFPEDYHAEDLKGKDAQFEVTLNYIVESVKPELTDDLVAEKISSVYGDMKTVEDFRTYVAGMLQENNIVKYVSEYLSAAEVSDVPEFMVEYQKKSFKAYYEEYAAAYGMEVNDLVAAMGQGSSIDALVESNLEDLKKNAEYYLVLQSIAEKEKISITDEDIKQYFLDNTGKEDYSEYVDYFGLNYVKCMIINNRVMDIIVDNVVISD